MDSLLVTGIFGTVVHVCQNLMVKGLINSYHEQFLTVALDLKIKFN